MMYDSLSRAVSLQLEELYLYLIRTECVTDYRGSLTSRLPSRDDRSGPISPLVHTYLPTLTVFPGVSIFFIKSPALLVIAPNLPKANKAKHKNPNFRDYHSFGT